MKEGLESILRLYIKLLSVSKINNKQNAFFLFMVIA